MKKLISSIIGSALLLSAISFATPATADYPAVSGLPLVAGSTSCPIAIDTTPKSIPANSKVATLSNKETDFRATSGKPSVLKFANLGKASYADATVRCPNSNLGIFLGTIKTDAKGNLQLPAFGLFKPGIYTLTVKVGKATRTIKVTVK